MCDEGLNGLACKCHAMAVEKGWYDTERSFPELIALCHTELSEAFERVREGASPTERWVKPSIWRRIVRRPEKPEGVPIEIADLLIRVLDSCAFYGIDIDAALEAKMAYNATRSYRHGNKVY